MKEHATTMKTPGENTITLRNAPPVFYAAWAAAIALFMVMYWNSFGNLYFNWNVVNSYYSHGFLIPPISLYFVWTKRRELFAEPLAPAALGVIVIAGAAFLLLCSDFLGFALFAQLSMVPMLTGLLLVLLGRRHAEIMWFPLIFLFFMVPAPYSITTNVSFQIKLIATEMAVNLAQALTLPMVRDGSYVYFGNDRLLVGDVCGGLRSLIALLAFGALMSYISKTRPWARIVILVVSGPIAIISNVLRIFLLCVVGSVWGSAYAVGPLHDVSGILIFAVAFALLLTLEGILRKIAPSGARQGEPK